MAFPAKRPASFDFPEFLATTSLFYGHYNIPITDDPERFGVMIGVEVRASYSANLASEVITKEDGFPPCDILRKLHDAVAKFLLRLLTFVHRTVLTPMPESVTGHIAEETFGFPGSKSEFLITALAFLEGLFFPTRMKLT